MERKFIVGEDTKRIVNLHIGMQEWQKNLMDWLRFMYSEDEADTIYIRDYEPHLLAIYKSLREDIGMSIEIKVDINLLPKNGEAEI